MNASVLGYLRQNPDHGLGALVEAGSIIADPPRDVALRGQRVGYSADDLQVTEMIPRVNQVLGEV
ncbi:hypothetical protein [Microbacterium sp. NPDC076911]|uniref:hypothetical protein n=1 Tax=Microbacterium sp. NPDC076911 TaxID=3154958 RepID=UPI00343F6BCF